MTDRKAAGVAPATLPRLPSPGSSTRRKSVPSRHRDETDEQLAEKLVRETSHLLQARGKPGQAAAPPPATRGSAPARRPGGRERKAPTKWSDDPLSVVNLGGKREVFEAVISGEVKTGEEAVAKAAALAAARSKEREEEEAVVMAARAAKYSQRVAKASTRIKLKSEDDNGTGEDLFSSSSGSSSEEREEGEESPAVKYGRPTRRKRTRPQQLAAPEVQAFVQVPRTTPAVRAKGAAGVATRVPTRR
jgi:hypothetical protein